MKAVRNGIFALAFLILAFGTGYQTGVRKTLTASPAGNPTNVTVNGKSPPSSVSAVDFSLFWDVWNRLGTHYVDKSVIVPQKMIYGAISGMVSSLDDPYTVFLPPSQNKESKEDLNGKFEGIGAQLGVKDKKIVIIAPLKDSPAQKAGLNAGDWIVKVDGKDAINWTLPEAVSKIRGPKGSTVKLTIVHETASKSADIVVTRDTINVASVEWEEMGCKEGDKPTTACKVEYIKLGRFGDQTNEEWDKAVDKVLSASTQSSGVKGLVLDLRNNPGGYLMSSIYVASEFLSDGTVVTQEDASGKKQPFAVDRKGKLLKIPLVVLINKGSASASEIVAGALSDRGRAKLVGETSFGKGSVQEVQELADGAGIHITVAKWLLPSGTWINGKGIEPGVKIENDVARPDEDLQLRKAIEMLQ